MMLYTVLKHHYCNYLRDNIFQFFVHVVMNFHCSLQGLCDFLYSFMSVSHFPSVFNEYKINLSIDCYYFIITSHISSFQYNEE